MLLLLTEIVVFGEIHSLFNAAEYAYLEETDPNSTSNI
jgi:hypothetical protein